MATSPLRIGVLGAAAIVQAALVRPARDVDGVEVSAVAARDRDRAAAFATKHRIPKVLGSYDELVSDPDVDAVYVPLPNGLHAKWTLAALEHGKHVLCEKPFAANADEAAQVADAAAKTDRVVMEAFHWRYHPLADRMIEVVRSGELGDLHHVETAFAFPNFRRNDIRWQPDLAGGALMDVGCYAIHWARTVAGSEPEVTGCEIRLRSPGIDRFARVDLQFPGAMTGTVTASMWSSSVLRMSIRVAGTEGRMTVLNPIAPQIGHRLIVHGAAGRRSEKVKGQATYTHQLRAFLAAVRNGAPIHTPPSESVANMRVIDASYRAGGLEPRRGATEK